MINKNYLLFCTLFLLLNGCQSIKDGLEGNKRSKSAEEFLIKQKNPLVIPPDFESLPEPVNVKDTTDDQDNDEFNINKIIGNSNSSTVKNSNPKINSLEQFIIKIIKKN